MTFYYRLGLAETIIHDGYFVTADHHELEIVQEKEYIKIIWIREKMKDPGASSWVSKTSPRNLCLCGGTYPPYPQLPQQAAGD
jgi:hypothetical protein